MCKFTKIEKNLLAERIAARTLNEEHRALNERRDSLAICIRDSILGVPINSIPDFVMRRDNRICFRWCIDAKAEREGSLPRQFKYGELENLNSCIKMWRDSYSSNHIPPLQDQNLIEEYEQYKADRAGFDAKYESVRSQAAGIINSISTYKRLMRVWPEVTAFLTEEEIASACETKNLPAIQVKQLNKLLGLLEEPVVNDATV